MPRDLKAEQAQIDELRRFWQPVLRLADWHIDAVVDPQIAPNLGLCVADHVYKRAYIRIAPSDTPGQDLEASLVHELVHPHFAAFETQKGSAERNEEERAVESLMRGLLDLKRGGASANAVQRLATRALDARARTRSLAKRRGEETHRMPNSTALAALAIEAGQMMATEGVPDECKALLKKFVEAMASGDEPPQSQNEPHAEGPPPAPGGDNKQPDAASRPMRGEQAPDYEARLRAIEGQIAKGEKERQAADERRRTAMLTEAKARIPEAQLAFAKALTLEQLTEYVSTLPAGSSVQRGTAALRGRDVRASDTETRSRLREAMGIPDTSVRLPSRGEDGRRTWPANAPSALRKALAAGGDS